MIDLYTWTTPNGRKVSIMLEELGLPYQAHAVDIGKDEQFHPDFLKISPNNKIPAIVDRDTGLSAHGIGRHPHLSGRQDGPVAAEGGRAALSRLEWLMWQMGGIGPFLGQAHHFLRFNKGKAPYAEERYRNEARRLYGVLDSGSRERDFVAGDYSIADIAIWPWTSRFEWQNINLGQSVNVKRWYSAIAHRPSVQKGYDVPSRTGDIPMP